MKRVFALLLVLAPLHGAPVAAAPVVDFLHVEANEGGSSGGHAALRVDDRVYHFEHIRPGLLRMRRTTGDAFAYAYATLGNRPIHAQRLILDDAASTQLRDTLSRRQLAQDAQLERHEALQRDIALFTRSSIGAGALRIPAAGLFVDGAPPARPDDLDSAATLQALADRIRNTYGATFLDERAARVDAEMTHLSLRVAADCDAPIVPDAFPTCATPVSTRWRDLATAARALAILGHRRALRAGHFQAPRDADFLLSAEEVAAFGDQARELEADLVALVASSRADWGFGFILGMARLVALHASVAQQRLVVVGDATAALGQVATFADDPGFPDIARAMESDAARDWLALRASAGHAADFREGDYTALELATHRVIALRAAGAATSPPPPRLELYASAPVTNDDTWPLAHMSDTDIGRARAVAAAYARRLQEAYAYNLITRNCVTEIVAIIDATLAPHSRRSVLQPLGFIPFVASDVVAIHHPATRTEVRPAHRERQIAEMSRHEPPIRVALRESNTLTSRIYRLWSRDSTFLFFTSDRVWTRPVLGIANLAVGAAATLLGAVRAPIEGPRALIAGARGVLYSLPELACVNIRKGTFAFVPRTTAPTAPGL